MPPGAVPTGVTYERDGPILRVVGGHIGRIRAPREVGVTGAELDRLIARQRDYFRAARRHDTAGLAGTRSLPRDACRPGTGSGCPWLPAAARRRVSGQRSHSAPVRLPRDHHIHVVPVVAAEITGCAGLMAFTSVVEPPVWRARSIRLAASHIGVAVREWLGSRLGVGLLVWEWLGAAARGRAAGLGVGLRVAAPGWCGRA